VDQLQAESSFNAISYLYYVCANILLYQIISSFFLTNDVKCKNRSVDSRAKMSRCQKLMPLAQIRNLQTWQKENTVLPDCFFRCSASFLLLGPGHSCLFLVSKSQDRKSASREKRSVVSFDEVKESRKSRDSESRRLREHSEREQSMQAELERQERKKLLIARERLAFHRHRLERERMERERLERERRRVEHERRREQERIHHEREELRRQQELRYEQERRPAVRRPYDYGRRDDAYWPEAKRAALDERYHSDFNRQDRFHDFDHRDRGRYPDHSVDRREGSRSIMGEREGQHYPERHGGPERHGRDSRDGWGGYGSDKRMSEGRGLPPPPRGRREWGDHGRRIEEDRAWQGAADGGMMDRDHRRWQGGERSMSGHMMNRGGMSGRGSFAPGGASRGHVIPRGGFGSRPTDAHFTRRY
ncbi:hypothetical protein FD754_000381, partial [Muntiacus muntjak]